MSYKLEKPYTEEQRMDFIVKYNHELELNIEETEDAIYALEANEIIKDNMPVINSNYENEVAQFEKNLKKEQLKYQLEELDKKRVRAICEPSMRTETQSWLEYYNEQVLQIRQVMANL